MVSSIMSYSSSPRSLSSSSSSFDYPEFLYFLLLSTTGFPPTLFLTMRTFPSSSIISSYSTKTLIFRPVLGSITSSYMVLIVFLHFLPVIGSIYSSQGGIFFFIVFFPVFGSITSSYSPYTSPSSGTSTITSLNASSSEISLPLAS